MQHQQSPAEAPDRIKTKEDALANLDEFDQLYDGINAAIVLLAATTGDAANLHGNDWNVLAGITLQEIPYKLDQLWARVGRVRDYLEEDTL